MALKLSKSEIRALRQICRQDGTVSGLAAKLGAKESFMSRVLRSLGEKGLVGVKKDGVKKTVQLSVASHAQNFKLLSDSRPDAKIEGWLSGFAMDILVVSEDGAETNLILEETGCTAATLYKTLKSLLSAGVLLWKNGRVEITDGLLKKFVASYADNIQLIAQRNAKGFNTSIRIRKNVVLRTDAKNVPPYFTQTGLSALAKNGLEAMLTSYDDFYFNLDGQKRELSPEESFIHALLLTTLQQHQDMPVLAIFFARNKRRLDLRAIKKLAKKYMVEGALEEIRRETEFHEKMKGFE